MKQYFVVDVDFSLELIILYLYVSVSNSIRSNMTTYEGIKSFYDYRKVTADQLKKDAQQLIDVSNNCGKEWQNIELSLAKWQNEKAGNSGKQ